MLDFDLRFSLSQICILLISLYIEYILFYIDYDKGLEHLLHSKPVQKYFSCVIVHKLYVLGIIGAVVVSENMKN